MKKTVLFASLVVLGCVSDGYAADILDATEPERILEIAKGYGSASLDTDADGDPRIIGRIKGAMYQVSFYGCNDGRNCKDIQFGAGWSGLNVGMSAINEWNKTNRWGNAHLDDEGDPIVEMSVNIRYGVTRRNLDDTFDWWRVVLEEFQAEVLRR